MKLKDISLDVDDNYIMLINDTVDEVKNVTLMVVIIDIKKFEFKNGIMGCLKLKDDSGTISGILIGNRNKEVMDIINNLKRNKTYLVKGNAVILRDPNDKELDFIKEKLSNFIKVGDMFIAIKALKEINRGR